MLNIRRVTISKLVVAAAALMMYGVSNSEAWSQSRYGGVYQEFKSNFCDNVTSTPCDVQFAFILNKHLKVLKASCTVLTSEGGSPSKEITGIQLGRMSETNNWVAGLYLAPIQSEFAGTGQVVLNVLADTLLVIPKNWRPAIRIYRMNNPPVSAQCTIVGEEISN